MIKKIIPIKVEQEKFNQLKEGLEDINVQRERYIKKGKYVDVIYPVIDKFIEAAKQNRGFEFIDYIKSWK